LPTYAFQRERFWLEAPRERGAEPATGTSSDETSFWQAVEQEDLDALTSALQVDDPDVRSSLATMVPALSHWRRHGREQATLGCWRYRIVWRPLSSAPDHEVSGSWLIVVPSALAQDELLPLLQGALTSRGASVTSMRVRDDFDRARLAARLREAVTDGV